MPMLHLAVLRPRLIALSLAVLIAVGLTAAGVLATGPAASSSPRTFATAPAPVLVADSVVAVMGRADVRIAGSRTLVVLGDSITARFTDTPGDELQGWWSILGDRVGAEPFVRAEGGAGFVNPGLVGCVGLTLSDQLALPEVARAVATAGIVVVEGGRTDTRTCRERGAWDDFRPVTDVELRAAVEAFMTELGRLRDADAGCTAVVVPWGPKGATGNRDRISGIVARAAAAHGFTYVDTAGLLTEATTMDDQVHPNLAGNRALADALLSHGLADDCVVR